jgi:prepilin-type N-terminal cleavage/methylation domain-containing protein
MRNYFSSNKSGFTLIEIIVSLALFSVVVTIAVGALLILIASNRQLQNEQSVLSNLSFALDSMTREIRTGSNYYCAIATSLTDVRLNPSEGNVGDCFDGLSGDAAGIPRYEVIAFDEGGNSLTGSGSSRIVYFHDRTDGKLYRTLGTGNPESIVSDGIYLSDVDFFVTGSGRTDGGADSDELQPKITIVIEAYNSESDFIADGAGDRAYVIQTTVTQRTLDI